MNQINVPCSACGKTVLFAEDPYRVAGATKYWSSTFEEPDKSMFVVQRRIPTNNKGKMRVKVTNEHILAVFCNPQCGLDYDTRNRAKVSD